MVSSLLALLLFCAPAPAQDELPLQRYLVDLYLGDSLETIQKVYPPAQEWPEHMEPRVKVRRYRVAQALAKRFPEHVEFMWLGLRRGRLVEIELVYDAEYTRQKSAEALAADLALTYGAPKRSGDKFVWSDRSTVLRVKNYALAVAKDGESTTEFRTALQLMTPDLLRRR